MKRHKSVTNFFGMNWVMDFSRYRVEPGKPFDPAAWPTREGDDFASDKKATRK